MASRPPGNRCIACGSRWRKSGETRRKTHLIRSTPRSMRIGWKRLDPMPHDHHDHDHFQHEGMSPSGHPYRADNDGPLTYWQCMEIAVRELLVEKGHMTPAEIAGQIEDMDARSPARGATVVARAWTDPAFREKLLSDAPGACREAGVNIGPLNLVAVENTERVHNLV